MEYLLTAIWAVGAGAIMLLLWIERLKLEERAEMLVLEFLKEKGSHGCLETVIADHLARHGVRWGGRRILRNMRQKKLVSGVRLQSGLRVYRIKLRR